MSTPGSSRNKKPDDGRRKQSGDMVAFNLPPAKNAQDRAKLDAFQANLARPGAFDPDDYNRDMLRPPTGLLDIRVGTLTHVPEYNGPGSRHQVAPGPYNGSGAVQRTPTHTTSQRINNFPQDLGGRSRGYPEAHQQPSQRPKDYPPQGQNAYYPSSMAAPQVPRSPDRVTGHRITMSMGQRPQPGSPQQAPRPGHGDPRYPSNGRGY